MCKSDCEELCESADPPEERHSGESIAIISKKKSSGASVLQVTGH